jgi:hypothetical protein
MQKPKRKYNVYLVRDGRGCYEGSEKRFLGSTFAVSEAQACNNVRHRCGGGYSSWETGDYLEEGSVSYSYKAELA